MNTTSAKNIILWADDEIDLLRPHVLFLQSKGYEVVTFNNGRDALEASRSRHFDVIILDENMPGLSGLDTLTQIKIHKPNVPVIMITKSEEENIMNQAIGKQIADYLIKPVNPNQILLSIKKNVHSRTIVAEETTNNYRQEFQKISDLISSASSIEHWYEVYQTLVRWELTLASAETNMDELLNMQKTEANHAFAKFIKRNYELWLTTQQRPVMSCDIMKTAILPRLNDGENLFFIVIDNFRLDQWKSVAPMLADHFSITDEALYTTILPTATQYARNSIFSGLMPIKIAEMFPDLWVDEDSEEGKNINESPLINTFFERYRKHVKFSYHKINDSEACDRLLQGFSALKENQLNVVVLNFVDMLSHARTESKMIRELAYSDAAYRSLTQSWFKHSSTLELFRRIAEAGFKIVLTTDHGTVKCNNAIKVVGDKNVNTNLRYKVGKNLNYNPKQVYEIKKPKVFGLPSPNVSSTYIFATGHDFMAYPNNYNHYVQYYSNTFQHGGISMEEMLVPIVTLTPKQ